MRIRTPLLVTAAAATMLASAALPALAAPGDTHTTFTLASGGLAVTPATDAALTTGLGQDMTVGAFDVVGSLGAVTVDDARGGGGTGWTVTASSTAFDLAVPILSPPLTGDSITSSTGVSYAHGDITPVGVTTSTGSPSAVVLTPIAATVVLGTLATGSNTATWTPDLTVSMPATARTGDYSGTVATSVA